MRGSGDDEEFLVALLVRAGVFAGGDFVGRSTLGNGRVEGLPASHLLEGIFSEVARVSLLAVNEQHGVLNLTGIVEDGLVEERLTSCDVPAVGAIARAFMIAAFCLVVSIIVFHEPGGSIRQRVDDTTGTLVRARLVVLGALLGQGLASLHALLLGVAALEVALAVHLRHVVHRGGYSGLDTGVDGSGVDGHATESANADDADALRVDIVLHGEEVNGSQEVLGVDVGRSHAAWLATTLTRKRGVEGDGEETALGHVLGIDAARLLLHGSERSGDGDGRQLALGILRRVHVGCELDTVAVVERDLLVVHLVTLGERLVPLLSQF